MGGIIIEHILEVIGNYFFPMVLSVYLVIKIDKLMSDIVKNQTDFQDCIIKEIKEIKEDILNIRIDMAKKFNSH